MEDEIIKAVLYEGRPNDYSATGTDLGTINIESVVLTYADGHEEEDDSTSFGYIAESDESFKQMKQRAATKYGIATNAIFVKQTF